MSCFQRLLEEAKNGEDADDFRLFLMLVTSGELQIEGGITEEEMAWCEAQLTTKH